MEGLAVLNIPSMHGGSNLWGESKKLDNVPKVDSSEVITDPELLKTISQGKRQLQETLESPAPSFTLRHPTCLDLTSTSC